MIILSKNSNVFVFAFDLLNWKFSMSYVSKKGYFRSTFIREMVMFCVDNDFSPIDLWKMFREYKDLRKYAADNKGKNIDG